MKLAVFREMTVTAVAVNGMFGFNQSYFSLFKIDAVNGRVTLYLQIIKNQSGVTKILRMIY